jgi:hypothetical protein
LIVSDIYAKTLLYYCSIAHSLNAKIHYNISGILITILVLFSQMIHYYNYKKGIKSLCFKPFEMISGLVSPKSVGLVEKRRFSKLWEYPEFYWNYVIVSRE